jgi:hypothetical protein
LTDSIDRGCTVATTVGENEEAWLHQIDGRAACEWAKSATAAANLFIVSGQFGVISVFETPVSVIMGEKTGNSSIQASATRPGAASVATNQKFLLFPLPGAMRMMRGESGNPATRSPLTGHPIALARWGSCAETSGCTM